MDKYRGITRLPLAESRLNHLLGRLSNNRANRSYNTQEELVRAYADICARIYRGFDKRVYDLPRAIKGAPASESDINLYLLGLYSEVLYLLDAIKGTAEMTEENFNFAISMIRGLQGGVKYCRQQLSTFALYATQYGDTLHFGETFSNGTNIDRGSNLLGQEECFVDIAEGTLSLPRLGNADQWKIDTVQVGALSNGILGNNTEAGTPIRGSIESLYDGNVDTWTEFERVVASEDNVGLRIELKIILGDTQTVNGIRVHPVFLGARTPPSILEIEVSEDGRDWVSLRDEVRVADFLDEDAEERFHLAPHTSKFAGEFNITFAPRFVKFVRLLIRQGSAFRIDDTYGKSSLRYAIGIKEIEIYGHKYAAAGEVISKPITFSRNISALGLQALVDPPFVPPEVGSVKYFISFTDGSSWNQITSLEEASLNVPEILYPPEGTTSLMYKLHLEKDELAFSQHQRESSILSFAERFGWSARRPFVLPLLHKPIEGSITVCDPEVATRGRIYPRVPIGEGVTSSLVEEIDNPGTYRRHGNTQLRLPLPMKFIKDPTELYIYVNNRLYDKVATFTDQWAKEYTIERSSDDDVWEIVFGNDDPEAPKGHIPGPSDNISMFLSEEYNVVEGLAAPYKMKLDYSSDGVKENTHIRCHAGTYGPVTEIMPGGTTRFKLAHENILVGGKWNGNTRQVDIAVRTTAGACIVRTSTGIPGASGVSPFNQYRSFVNGDSELLASGEWTVDPKEGVIYLHEDSPTLPDYEYVILYVWDDTHDIAPENWDFVSGKLDEIQIYENGYKTASFSNNITILGGSAGDTSLRVTDLNNERVRGIVAKSLRVQDGLLNGYRAFEVPFIDGRAEFEGRAKIQDEVVPAAVAGADTVASFQVTHWQNLVPSASIFFDDPTQAFFAIEKANYASLIAVGDYYFQIDTSGPGAKGTLFVKLNNPGDSITANSYTMSYHYYDEFSAERMKGAYSIDAINGIIYFAEPLVSSDLSKEISFKYTPYRARYNISIELVEGVDYEVDTNAQVVTVKTGASGFAERALAVNYKYHPEESKTLDLAPYYSPLVRAIDIKVS